MVLILLGAAALSFGLGEADEATIIALIVVASSGLSFYQEFRASNTVAALQQRLAIKVNTLRDGKSVQVPAAEIVAGDVVVLAGGSLVPADAILLATTDLHVDEAALTGESFPAVRTAAAGKGPATDDNLIYMGTSIRSGSATALIVRTGAATQYGAIAKSVSRIEPETSFAKGIRNFSLLMTQVMMVIVVLVLVVNLILGRPILDSLLFAAALAVGLTPELLPAIVTVTLAQGARKLAQSGVLVKRLVAIENLGAMDVLCTDKTGTLTEGDVRLQSANDAKGDESADTLKLAFLNASLQTGLPNPLDSAIIAAGKGVDITGYQKLSESPYDFERQRLAVLVAGPDGNMLICKGSVVAILPTCDTVLVGGRNVKLTPARLKSEETRLAAWSGQGLRVLALATKAMDSKSCSVADETKLTLIGYLLFSDPPKPGIAETIASLGDRGVKLKIITGDNRYVAAHVAAEVGIAGAKLMTGPEVAKLGPHALALRTQHVDLFAEVTPDQKERIIVALRHAHKVVGYMGDGINDGPALKAADVGISVESAVDIAKETADIILLEKSLAVLGDGVLEGRKVFGNITKYIKMGASSGFGNMFSVIGGSVFLPFLPMAPIQVLTNNLLYDFSQTTIPTDNVDAEYLAVPRRWDIGNISKFVLLIGPISSIFDYVTFFLMLGIFHAWDKPALFQTGWFVESLLTQTLIIHIIRTAKLPFIESRASLPVIATSLIIGVIGIALPYTPFGSALGFVQLPPAYYLYLCLILVGYAVLTHIIKTWCARKFGLS